MKAYVKNKLVLAIGSNDSLFPNCEVVEITEEQKKFIENCECPRYNGVDFFDEPNTVVIVPQEVFAIPFLVQLELIGINEGDIIAKIIQLHDLGLLDNEQKIMALISVKRATKFERSHPFIQIIASAFEKTSEEIDQIFINANI